MINLTFQSLNEADTDAFLSTVAKRLRPKIELPNGKIIVQFADLDFYQNFKLYSLTDTTTSEPKVHYLIYGPSGFCLLDWTNDPIYDLNERAPIVLNRRTCIPYARFFFHFVRGRAGSFLIVEKPEEIGWLPAATKMEKDEVNSHLMPITYHGIGRDNLITLTATVIFKNALFRTDIKIAPYDVYCQDLEEDGIKHYNIGQMALVNEELLLENLNVPIALPPNEFE